MSAAPLQDYVPAAGRFDEVLDADGVARPHWDYLLRAISMLDRRQLRERQWEMRRLLIEHGISYNIYSDGESRVRPWALDLLPFVISSREWREVEVGLAQRAELLRHVLHDIYGPQKLLLRGLLPAQLIYANPAFLAPCQGVGLPIENSLTVYAADLGRSPDGRLWVTQDRAQAPSGIGYALAARMVISRVLPSIFRESSVHPVLPFLRSLRSALMRLAQGESERIALLTAGSANETYAEQAFLARQLGLPLVEGADLQVAGGACWMLGTGARQPVSVLLRRMDDTFCDPLELNRQSLLGSPGMLQAVRNRRLNFANPLGAGVLESPALIPFLPGLCRELLGEELKLPSVSSWWCGREQDLWYVKNHFEQMVIRSVQPKRRGQRTYVAGLSSRQRADLLARIEADPTQYVAQTAQANSSAPVIGGAAFNGHPISMRTFAVATAEGFRVMSGGIARAARTPEGGAFSNQLGGLSKDIWVLASEPQRDSHTLAQFLPRLPRPRHLTQPHVAENLIWMGRYAARCELLSRMLRLVYERLGEDGRVPADPATRILLRALSWQTTLYPGFIGPMGEDNLLAPDAELQRIARSAESGSLAYTVSALATAAQPVRDLLVPEVSELLGRLNDAFDQDGSPAEVNEQVYLLSAALNGHLLRSLADDGAAMLLELGYALESALGAVRLLRSLLIGHDRPVIEVEALLLQLANSLPAFEASGEEGDGYALVYTLLLAEANPQSVRRAMMVMERLLRSAVAPDAVDQLEARIAAKLTELGTLDLRSIAQQPESEASLDRILLGLDQWLRETAEQITARYTPRRAAPQSQLVQTA